MSNDLKKLQAEGLVHVSYPSDLRQVVEKAIESWKGFCAISEGIKTSFPYFEVNGVGAGYELKKIQGSALDLKEDFHFTRGASVDLAEKASIIKHEAINRFLRDAEMLSATVTPFVEKFAEHVEEKIGLPGFADEVRRSVDISVIRFLHYFGGSQPGDEIAKAHADKSGFTLHLYESDPGLEYLDRDLKWREMPVSPDETVVIPGMRGQYRSKGDLKATFHRVVATQETAVSGRYSAVAFIHLKDTPAYDKARGGRLQEFEPGFNYDMPFREFSKLFIA